MEAETDALLYAVFLAALLMIVLAICDWLSKR